MGQAQANLKGSTRLGTYLRKLRSGYGYSLRRVEECARAEGGEIDNSQLSRYEKGICYPSFDKLRILASVFNVSIQSFSDVVDLEGFEELKPAGTDALSLIEEGIDLLRAGNNGHAFAIFERSLELLNDAPMDAARQEMMARARINQATALRRLGKLSLAEQELRQALRTTEWLTPTLQARAMLALANIHGDLGDVFLSELEAQRAYEVARDGSLDQLAGMALHTLARVLHDQGQFSNAIEKYREAARYYAVSGEYFEAIRARISTGACYASMGKSREGIRLLRASLGEARGGGHRRLEAYAWSEIGQAYYRQKDLRRARSCLRESDALAIREDEKQFDILFGNSYYEWKMAIDSENPTREKIAFGRMKALRSHVERRLAEVEAFDLYVERGRKHV